MLVSFGYVAAYFAGVSVFPAASTLLYILFLCYFSYYFVFFNLFNFFKFEAGYSNGLYQVYCFWGHGRSVLVATLGNANPTATQFATLNKEWRKSVY